MDQNTTTANGENVVVSPKTAMVILLGTNITKVEFNGNVAANEEEKVTFIRHYIRNRVLKMFGVNEVAKTPVTGGKLYFNEGNRSALKLPAVKEDTKGNFAETLEEYYSRIKPEIAKWLGRSIQTSTITVAQVSELG